MRTKINIYVLFIISFLFVLSSSSKAHCDGVDGPVVKAAVKALEQKDVNLVLIWVQQKDEAEIKEAFNRTLAVRDLSSEAKQLADNYFFETLVRIHRAGEGAPYTGLKPAGRDLGPAVTTGDKVVESGDLMSLFNILKESVHNGLHSVYEDLESKKDFKAYDVDAGREFVEAYVKYIHYVENVYNTSKHTGGHTASLKEEQQLEHQH